MESHSIVRSLLTYPQSVRIPEKLGNNRTGFCGCCVFVGVFFKGDILVTIIGIGIYHFAEQHDLCFESMDGAWSLMQFRRRRTTIWPLGKQ